MKLQITGTLRSVANSAWVSTLDEAKADQKSDQEVLRVAKFLVKENHTTPFESVTLTYSFFKDGESDDESDRYWEMAPFLESPHVRISPHGPEGISVTTDLYNFIKIAKGSYVGPLNKPMKENEYWRLFEATDPLLASVVEDFELPPQYDGGVEDVSSLLGQNDISVELIEVHNASVHEHVRATWRVCAPLSIIVQMLRHRKASFNMASGRYRTLNQEMVDFYRDVSDIFEKIKDPSEDWAKDFISLLETNNSGSKTYKKAMIEAKKARDANVIDNDEYKRFREFARYVLPEGRMTDLYCTFYLPDFEHYLQLRDSKHAQVEHVFVAQQMKKTLNMRLKDDFKIKSKYI
jgi:flavin-dependent thymidylate synthase